MKRRLAVKLNYRKTIVLALVSFMGILSLNYSSGPALNGVGANGAPYNSGSTCASCHSGGNFGAGVTLQLLSGSTPVTSYTAGQSYTVRITRTATTQPNRFGFQIAAAGAVSPYTNNNGWGTAPSGTANRTLSGRNYIEHSSAILNSVSQINIPWTAPSPATGDIAFHIALNSVNLDGGTGGDQVVSASMTITAPCVTAPTVTTNPTSPTVCANATATFTAAASGNPAPGVQWQVSTNGGSSFTNISGATNNTYSFTAVAGDNGKQYKAVYTNSCGSASSTAGTLTVNGAPTVSTQPVATTGCAGTPVTFTAAANNANTIQWQTSTNGGSSYTAITGATNGSYTFTPTSANNTHRYRAFFNGTCGFVFSSGAILTVNSAPTIGTQPTAVTVCSGASASFTASATGTPTPTVQWQVNTDGINWNNIAGATTNTYSLTTTGGNNGNLYRAVYTNTCGSTMSNGVLLTVNTPPTIDLDPASAIVCAGTTVNFGASASGTPTPTVQWQINTGSGWNSIAGATNNTYSFTASASDNGNQYQAVYTNTCGSVTSQAGNLTISTPGSPSVSASASSTSICAGTSVTFTATPTNGGSSPTYQWNMNGSPVAGATNVSYTSSTLANGDAVNVTMTSNQGCLTTQTASSSDIVMTVNSAPTINLDPASAIVCEGTVVHFSSSAGGSPAPSIQWQVNTGSGWNDISGATSNPYSITATMADNGNQYRTKYTNTCGFVFTTPGSLTVNASVTPAVSASASATSICAGTSVIFTATPTNGGATPGYQWMLNGTPVAGATNSTYNASGLNNGDAVNVEMTSSASCASPASATSNTVIMSVNSLTTNTTTATACNSYTWAVNGQTYTSSGTYAVVNGCTTDQLNLTINQSSTTTETVAAAGSYTWNGQTYTASGTYTWVGTNASGCDSTVTLNLTITTPGCTPTTGTETAAACDSYTWHGTTYTASTNSATWITTNAAGCDSVVTLNLTITASTSNTSSITACDSYTWAVNGQTYTTSGTYTNVSGCHTETLVLTVTPSTTNTSAASACGSYTWNGQTYTASGTYSHVTGCHTEVLNLTITPLSGDTVTATACDTYTWSTNGQSYTTSGNYTHTVGCHTHTLMLTITPSTSNTTTASACNSYTWAVNGQTYMASGTYTATTGCHTETLNLTISTASGAQATITPVGSTTICATGGSVVLTASAGASYLWSNGAITQSITASQAGNYSVQVLSAGGCSSQSATVAVTSKVMPATVKIKAMGATTVCAPGEVVFVLDMPAGSTSGFAYQWNLNGSAITGATDSTYATSATGAYTVTVSGGSSCSKTSAAKTATVKPTPTADFTVGGATSFCSGGSVTFTAAPAATGATYAWLKNGTTNAGSGASKTFAASGDYSLVVTLAGCKDTSDYSELVTVYAAAPAAKVAVLGASTVCAPNTVSLQLDASVPSMGSSFQWNLDGTAIAGANDSTYNADTSGMYTLTLTTADGCTKTSAAKKATVKPLPVADFTAAGPTEFCAGGNVTLHAPVMPGYTYTWLKDGLNAGSGAAKAFKISGVYTLVATLAGCKDTSDYSETITVNPLPIAGISTADPTTFCAGGSAELNATPTGMFHTYAWYRTNVLDASVITEDYTATLAGTYKVIVTDDKSCVSKLSSSSVVIKVNPIPVASITAQGSTSLTPGASVKLKATPASGVTWQWYVDLQPIAGATGKEYIATAGGNYAVEVTKLGCTGMSPVTTVTMDIVKEEPGTTSNPVENAGSIFEIGAFPNPVNGMLTVNIRGIDEVNATLQVMDMNGKLVATQQIHEASAKVDMSSYASGMYLVRYKDTEGRTATIKINKQ